MNIRTSLSHVPAYAGDPILSLNEQFQADPRAGKVNLSIGMYFDDEARMPLMGAVRDAEALLQARGGGPRPYLPMGGSVAYRDAVQALVFGASHEALRDARIATLQTLGGSGALKVGADFLRRYFPEAEVWISDPSWENHRVVFEGAGFAVHSYPYYDEATGGLRFAAMRDALERIPAGSIVLLHACCHNPTGVDLDGAQWRQLAELFGRRGLIAFIDMAYQGFGESLEADAAGVRGFASAGFPCLVASSFSKNFSLYGERCGALSVVCASALECEKVYGQLTATVRANYSNPPTHGAAIVAAILGDAELRACWAWELGQMRDRMQGMRRALHQALHGRASEAMRERYLVQRGMFTYTGLTEAQVLTLREAHGIYLLRSGRMCIAGLNDRNVAGVADAIAQTLLG